MSYLRHVTLAALAASIAACASTQGGGSSDADEQTPAAPADTNPGAVNTGNVALTDTMSAISQPRPMAPTSEAAQGDTVKGESTDAPAGVSADTTAVTADSASGRTTGVGGTTSGGGQIEAQLDTTISAARRGLTSLAPSVAVGVIDSFHHFLSDSDNPALTSIATDLTALRAELTKPAVDGRAVGQVLSRLGGKTTAVAPSAGILSERVASLGQALMQSGTQLSSGN